MTRPGVAKQSMLLALQHFIYKPVQKKLDDRKIDLCMRHSLKCPNNSTSFMYKANLYWATNQRAVKPPTLLVRSLHGEMDKWLEDSKELSEEMNLTRNFFTTLLLTANTEADVCALLPDCIKSALVHPVEPSNTYTEEFIAAFHKQHSKSIQMIKERLLLNLIN